MSDKLIVNNPATGEMVAELQLLSPHEIEFAVTKAAHAFNDFKKFSIPDRIKLLKKVFKLIKKDKERLSLVLTSEQGKTLAESNAEIDYSASYFEWYASCLEDGLLNSETQQSAQNRQRLLEYAPVGVVAAITPWNFPSAMIARKVAAAVAAGCAIIIKPALETPLSAIEFEKIFLAAGAPESLVSVVLAEAEDAAKVFFRRNQIRKISFTGSTKVGKELMVKAATQVKRLTLELGGNAPVIVLEDADIDRAVNETFYAKFRNAGQSCIAVNRVLIAEEIFEKFSRKFIDKAADLKIGSGLDSDTTLGPLINEKQKNRVHQLVEEAIKTGAKVLYDGNQHMDPKSFNKNFYAPVVLKGIHSAHQLWSEEIFGPVTVLYPVSTDKQNNETLADKMIHLANDTKAGLAAYLFSQDGKRIQDIVSELEYGMIGINDSRISAAQTLFGGVKESGFGIEGGKEGILEYCVRKTSIFVD